MLRSGFNGLENERHDSVKGQTRWNVNYKCCHML